MKKDKEKINEKDVKKLFYKLNPCGGISLIVLVITIIVVIILAAAVIISLQNNNPMIEANKARINSDVANMQAIFTNTVGKIMAEKQEVIGIIPNRLNDPISDKKSVVGEAVYTINNEESGKIIFDNKESTEVKYYTGRKLPVYNKETIWYVDDEGILRLQIGDKLYGEGWNEQVPMPPEDESAKVGEIVKDKTKDFIDENGDKATIPIDFAIVPGKDVVKDGLVISDMANDIEDAGNQFVWIPVNDMSKFVREAGYYKGKVQTSSNGGIDISKCKDYYDGASQIQEYNNMIDSIRKNKGFYIGRYEISRDISGNIESKKNKIPLANISFSNSITDLTGGIVQLARSMYPEVNSNIGNVVSTLMYGVAFDEVVRFLKTNEKYINIEKDSTGYGNTAVNCNEDGFSTENRKSVQTGSNPEYALNNIYDIVGNLWEWSMESYDNYSICIYRGCGIDYNASYTPISHRGWQNYTTYASDAVGGRIQLYIK